MRLWKVHKNGYGRIITVGQAHVDACWIREAAPYEEAEDEAFEAFWG